MSKYTTEVRYICEMNSGFPVEEMSSHTPDQIIAASRSKIFDFSYPIYESGHKPELETKILKHYYTREIGAETVGLWKLWLNERLNLIMPKYNKLYKMEAETIGKELQNIDVEFHSLREDDFTKLIDETRTDNLTHTSENTRTDNLADSSSFTRTDNLTDEIESDTSGSSNRLTTDKFSDTPQGTVTNVNNDTYLTEYRSVSETETTTGGKSETGTHTGTQTNVGSEQHTGTQKNTGTNKDTGTQKNTGTNKDTGNQEITTEEKGYRGSKTYYDIMADYADKILNIDNLIINDLRDLFILLW